MTQPQTINRKMTQTHKRASPILGLVSFIKCWNWRRHNLSRLIISPRLFNDWPFTFVRIRMKENLYSIIGISAQKENSKYKGFQFKTLSFYIHPVSRCGIHKIIQKMLACQSLKRSELLVTTSSQSD